ncbi:MAG: methionine--tRNA ligase [Nanoarchaeota archaeon]
MTKKKFYITTAIDYVNSRPHIGHAFEKVIADAIARWKRLNGEKVWFLTGTDENAQKNEQAAKAEGIDTKKFVDRNSKLFIDLCKKLNISYDDFIRTTEIRHKKIAQEIFKKVYEKGDIYKGKYKGLYCSGCEAYLTEKDLTDGKCPEHGKEPVEMSEETYFFRLSKYRKELIKFVENYIVPEEKKNEILSRLRSEELKDLCVARANLDWGIDNPIDKKFKIYVWFDALINYISGANGNWPADVHIVGKGINWFHSVIWPAMLMSAGYKLPKKLLVHGYLTVNGNKMSKSLGNSIDPMLLADKYSVDSLRYFLLRNPTFDDYDFSEKSLIERHNSELANKLGNLVSRVSALAEKFGIEKTENKLLKKLKLNEIEKHFDNFELDKALNLIFEFIDSCNLYVQENELWKTGDRKKLYELADSIKAIGILIYPFIPSTSEKIAKNLGFKLEFSEIKKPLKVSKIKKGEILFVKVEEKENINKAIMIEGIAKMGNVKFGEWANLDLRVAQIKKVEDIEGADKLYKLIVDVGELGDRVICAGIKAYYSKEKLKNKKIIIISNLEPRVLRGIESKGMLLAAGSKDRDKCVLIKPDNSAEDGARIEFRKS